MQNFNRPMYLIAKGMRTVVLGPYEDSGKAARQMVVYGSATETDI